MEKDKQLREKNPEIGLDEYLIFFNFSDYAVKKYQSKDVFYYAYKATELFKEEYKTYTGDIWFYIYLNASMYYLEREENEKAIACLERVPDNLDKKSKELFNLAISYDNKIAVKNVKILEE